MSSTWQTSEEYGSINAILPSHVLWTPPIPVTRQIGAAVGAMLALAGLVSVFRLIWTKRKMNLCKVPGLAGAVVLPYVIVQKQQVIVLNFVMIMKGVIALFLPEFTSLVYIFEIIYRGFAYHAMLQLVAWRFGGLQNLCRDDLSGTLQQHDHFKIWAERPCCCVSKCEDSRTIGWNDVEFVQFLVRQFLILGPGLAIMKEILIVEAAAKVDIGMVEQITTVLTIASQMSCVYAVKVVAGVADKCVARWADRFGTPPRSMAKMNIWVAFITVLPSLIELIIGFCVKDPQEQPNGYVLRKLARKDHLGGYVVILFGFLGAIWAWWIFPPNAGGDEGFELEFLGGTGVAVDRLPPEVVSEMSQAYTDLLATRPGADGYSSYEDSSEDGELQRRLDDMTPAKTSSRLRDSRELEAAID